MTDSQRPPYEVEFYETTDGYQPARRWMRELAPTKRRALGRAIARVLAEEGVGVCRTEWGKNLGQGLCEFRLRDEINVAGASVHILLRVFFHAFGNKQIVLLHGYDKGEHPGERYQGEQIEIARKRLTDFLMRRRRVRGKR